jgi:hypothetical protein
VCQKIRRVEAGLAPEHRHLRSKAGFNVMLAFFRLGPLFCRKIGDSAADDEIGSQKGLPDGIFSNQKFQFWEIAMEDVGIFFGHLVYLKTICYIYGYLVDFFPFGSVILEKIWQP